MKGIHNYATQQACFAYSALPQGTIGL